MRKWRPLRRLGGAGASEDEFYIREVWEHIDEIVSLERLEKIEALARERVQSALDKYGSAGLFYWSGGKDSLALEGVMRAWPELPGYFFCESLDFVFSGMAPWYAASTPERVFTDNGGWGFETIRQRPALLFPVDQKAYGAWDRNKWKHQNAYRAKHGVEIVFTGRRIGDGNFCGKDGVAESSKQTTINPIYDWSFEEVLAYIKHVGLDLPPCYTGHDKGFEYGTAPWAKIKFATPAQGWAWLKTADPVVYERASQALRYNPETPEPEMTTTENGAPTHDTAPRELAAHPISSIEWRDPADFHANGYNPNKVFPPEMALLKLSILEDGWTQPIVVNRETMEIIDGFHRWTLASSDPQIIGVSGGKVPVAFVAPADAASQQMSTIRHNRARGTHGITAMSNIVRDLKDRGLGDKEIRDRLGMEQEEIDRLYDFRSSTERVGQDSFGKGWVPVK